MVRRTAFGYRTSALPMHRERRDVIEFLKVELAAVTVGFLVTIWVTRELRGASGSPRDIVAR